MMVHKNLFFVFSMRKHRCTWTTGHEADSALRLAQVTLKAGKACLYRRHTFVPDKLNGYDEQA